MQTMKFVAASHPCPMQRVLVYLITNPWCVFTVSLPRRQELLLSNKASHQCMRRRPQCKLFIRHHHHQINKPTRIISPTRINKHTLATLRWEWTMPAHIKKQLKQDFFKLQHDQCLPPKLGFSTTRMFLTSVPFEQLHTAWTRIRS